MADLKPPPWKFQSQSATLGIGPDGKATEGYQVYFVTGSGQQGSVFVVRSLYNPANVAAAIAAHAAELEGVAKLSG